MLLLTHLIFDVAFAALATLNALLLLTVLSSSIKLWPTPPAKSWQHYTFWPLFRGGLGLTLLYAILTAHWPLEDEALPFAIGMICVVAGFGFTIYGYFDLGIENTYGADEGLVTNGLYRYSRNPQYVASILGFWRRAGERRDPHGDSVRARDPRLRHHALHGGAVASASLRRCLSRLQGSDAALSLSLPPEPPHPRNCQG